MRWDKPCEELPTRAARVLVRHTGAKPGVDEVHGNPRWISHLPGPEGIRCRGYRLHNISDFASREEYLPARDHLLLPRPGYSGCLPGLGQMTTASIPHLCSPTYVLLEYSGLAFGAQDDEWNSSWCGRLGPRSCRCDHPRKSWIDYLRDKASVGLMSRAEMGYEHNERARLRRFLQNQNPAFSEMNELCRDHGRRFIGGKRGEPC